MKQRAKAVLSSIGLYILGILGTALLGFVVGLILGSTGNEAVLTDGSEYPILSNIVLGVTTVGYAIFILLYTLRREIKSTYTESGAFELSYPTRDDARQIGLGVVVSLVIGVSAFTLLDTLPLQLDSVFTRENTVVSAVVFSLVSIVIVGPCEEFLFRGAIQNRLNEDFDDIASIVIAGLLFGSVHILNYQGDTGAIVIAVLAISVVGMVFGYFYQKSGNFIVPVLIHGLYNTGLSIMSLF